MSKTSTILVVEDSPRVRPLIARILESAGFRVLLADSPAAALMLLDATVDALLTDVMLPGKSGFELAAQARERCPDLRVLYMSGFDLTLPDGLDFVQKPFRPDELVDRVRTLLT